MRVSGLIKAGAAALALFAAATPGAATADVADLYKGKTLTILIGHPPGGSYDLYAQLTAAHFSKFVPGNPDVIVQHMPGGGGRKGAAFFYNKTAPDGLTVAVLPDTLGHIQLLTPKRADWDAKNFRYIGRYASANSAFAIRKGAPAQTTDEMAHKETIVACTGKAARSAQMPALVENVLGYKYRLICGYKGSSASKIAMLRGEVDMFSANWATFKANDTDAIADGTIKIVMQAGVDRDPDLPDVPLLQDLTDDPKAKRLLRFASSAAPLGRSMMAAPGTPEEVITALRKAFQEMVKDPDFLADAAKRQAIIDPATGEAMEAVNAEIMSADPELVAATIAAMDTSKASDKAN